VVEAKVLPGNNFLLFRFVALVVAAIEAEQAESRKL